MQVAIGLWTLAFALFAAAPVNRSLAYALLFVGTFFLGVGEAVYAPTADALPAALAPPHLRGRYAALHQMAWGISETITPALVGVLLAHGAYTLWVVLGAAGVGGAIAYRSLEPIVGSRDGVAGGVEVDAVEAAGA
jgi:MFS family permease